ncbi:MAG: GNAT family N-acetyltransferase [Planctomycetales bacterium]|nr:GNAT family N-acetyltransferase [Planctomycetales bacterium]
MTTAPLKQSESSQLLSLWNRSVPYDQLQERVLREKIWGDTGFREDLSLVVHLGREPIAFAMGVVRETVVERRGYIKLLAVAPEHRRHGIARELVQEMHDKLNQHEIDALRLGESAPNYLFPGIDTRYTEAANLAESMGYQRVGQSFNLLADLVGKDLSTGLFESDLASKGIAIRRAGQEDAAALDALVAEHWLAWRDEIATAMKNDPISIHLAIQEEKVVGFSAYDSNNLGTGWFGPMGTHPQVQGQGIGRVLMLRCLRDIQAQGHHQATIAWVSPTRLYAEHANAKPDRTFARYEKRFFQLGDKLLLAEE